MRTVNVVGYATAFSIVSLIAPVMAVSIGHCPPGQVPPPDICPWDNRSSGHFLLEQTPPPLRDSCRNDSLLRPCLCLLLNSAASQNLQDTVFDFLIYCVKHDWQFAKKTCQLLFGGRYLGKHSNREKHVFEGAIFRRNIIHLEGE